MRRWIGVARSGLRRSMRQPLSSQGSMTSLDSTWPSIAGAIRSYQHPAHAARAPSRRRRAGRARASRRHRAAGGTRARAPGGRPARGAALRVVIGGADRPQRQRRRPVGPEQPGLGAAVGALHVSGRNTIGASRPLAPCTVMTRTSSRPWSRSRLISVSPARASAGIPPASARSALIVSASARNSSIGSAASGPSRAIRRSRPPRPRMSAKSSKGGVCVGRASRARSSRAPAPGGRSVARSRSRAHRRPARPWPARKDRRRRSRTAAPSAPSPARGRPPAAAGSAPAPPGPDRELLGQHHAVDAGDGNAARFSALTISSKKASRRRTRIITSPGWIGRPRDSSSSPLSSMCLTAPAMRRASCRAGSTCRA